MTQRHNFVHRSSTSDASTASPEPRVPQRATGHYRSQTPPASAPAQRSAPQRSFGSSQPRWGSGSPQRRPATPPTPQMRWGSGSPQRRTPTPPSRRTSFTPAAGEGDSGGAPHAPGQHSAARAETRRHSLAATAADAGRPRHNSSPHPRPSTSSRSPAPRVRRQPAMQRQATFPQAALQSNPSFQQTASAGRPSAMYRAASMGVASASGAVPSGHSTFVNPAYGVPQPESFVSGAVRQGSAIPRIYAPGQRPRTHSGQQAPASARSVAGSRSGRSDAMSRSGSGHATSMPYGRPSSRHGQLPVGVNPRMVLNGGIPMLARGMPGMSSMGNPMMGGVGGMQAAQMMAMQQSIVQNNMMLSRMFNSGRRSGSQHPQSLQQQYPMSREASAQLGRSPSQVLPAQAPAPAPAPAPPSVDPSLLKALEEKLSELAVHQTTLVTQIDDLNSNIAAKDATIREMQTSRKRGAARAEAEARDSREAMLAEMGKLRGEVVTMQAHMNDAAQAAKTAGEAKAAAEAAEAQARRAMEEQAAATRAAAARAAAEAEVAQAKKLLSVGTVASLKSSERQLNISEHTETDASSDSPGQSRERCDEWEAEPGAAARRRLTMRTPWGDEAIGGDTDEGDDLDYFVPIMQKQREDLTEIFHSAQRVAMLPGADAGDKRRSSHTSRGDSVSKRLSSGAALTLEL